jgi:hypothetical protein
MYTYIHLTQINFSVESVDMNYHSALQFKYMHEINDIGACGLFSEPRSQKVIFHVVLYGSRSTQNHKFLTSCVLSKQSCSVHKGMQFNSRFITETLLS